MAADSHPEWIHDGFETDLVEITSPPSPPSDTVVGESISLAWATSNPSESENVLRFHSIKDLHSSEVLVDTGMICTAKVQYEGKKTCLCCIKWEDEPPKDVNLQTKDPLGGFAVLIRKRKGHGEEPPLVMHSLAIQSPLIKKVLAEVLKDYPGVAPTEVLDLCLEAPFESLFHRWQNLLKAGRDDPDVLTRRHVKVLRDILEPEFEDYFEVSDECRLHGVITFRSLWIIFEPGELIFTAIDGEERLLRLNGGSYVNVEDEPCYELYCEHVDWDGTRFGLGQTPIQIYQFNGTITIEKLPAMPLKMHADQLAIKERLSKRGRKFEELRGYHFKAYSSSVIDTRDCRDQQLAMNDERIIVDAAAYEKFDRVEVAPELIPLTKNGIPNHFHPFGAPRSPVNFRHNHHQSELRPPPPLSPPLPRPGLDHKVCGYPGDFDLISQQDRTSNTHKRARHGRRRADNRKPPGDYNPDEGGIRKLARTERVDPLTEDQLLLCLPHVRAFLLSSKKWHLLNVNGIKDITWNEEAFDSLVLPNDEKELLLAFAEGQANPKASFDDFIQGKGKGIVILLNGPPGVGKTLTAECVAETMRVPLYALGAGELGNYAITAEQILKNAFEKCVAWKSMLLVDEADVFLEKRQLNDGRNELVSLFLRLIEYYSGTMFLTTNRVSSFDPAFESRLDIAVDYPPLTETLRRQIWSNFIMRLPAYQRNISEADLDALAKRDVNGRHIKSVVKTAQMLAVKKKEPLSIEHTEAIFRLRDRARFD